MNITLSGASFPTEQIIARVNSEQYPFTATDLAQIKKFSATERVEKATHFSKGEYGLKRSLFIVPEDAQYPGTYILCKGKGTDEVPGGMPLGACNRATIAINIDTGEKMVCRSTLKIAECSSEEALMNLVNQQRMKYVLGGMAIHYTGRMPETVEKTERKDKGERTFNPEDLMLVNLGVYEKVAYLMPYCEKGELYDDTSTGEKMLRYISDVALGIKECHDNGIVHYDIKPENIFLKGDGALLADLDRGGFQSALNQNPPIPTTAGFMPPELMQLDIKGKPLPKDYDVFTCDLWQFGVVIADKFYGPSFVDMMNNFWAYRNVDLKKIKGSVKELEQNTQDVPPVVPKMVSKLLSTDPKARGTINEIVALLNEDSLSVE